jgi:hypothetical protein
MVSEFVEQADIVDDQSMTTDGKADNRTVSYVLRGK